MPLTVLPCADGPRTLRSEQLPFQNVTEARNWAAAEIAANPTLRRARIYDGPRLLSEVGFCVLR